MSDSESEKDISQQNDKDKLDEITPLIEPINVQMEKKKTKRKYTISEKVKKRNAVNSERLKKFNAENNRKIKEYERLVQSKAIGKEEVEELFNNKFSDLAAQLEGLKNSKQEQVPEILEPIKEEPIGYVSEGGTRRLTDRFNRQYDVQNYSRFRKY
jgi:inorganic pyrophosphatase/exopolyphosphatase